MPNPLLEIQFKIPFDRIKAEHIEPAIDTLIADATTSISTITSQDGPLTYESTLAALDTATETLEWAAGVVGHLESVATTPELRAAYESIQPQLSRFWTGLILNEDLWSLLKRYADTEGAAALTGVYRRHLTKTIDDFKRHGADLGSEGKREIERINVELTELTTRFSQNVLDATNAFELLVGDEARLAGLPESARAAAKESAETKGRDGWRFTLQAPSVIPVFTYLKDAQIREQIWTAFTSRGTEPPHYNVDLVANILKLRRERAAILGFDNFADLTLTDRMAGSGARAWDFVTELREKTLDAFARENEELRAFQKAQDGTDDMQPWDVGYYAEALRRQEYEFDEEELRPYFPVDRVVDGLFQTIGRLYGVTVRETSDPPTWDEQVRTFELRDEDGTHLGSFYVDLFPRENKRDGAWMNSLITGRAGSPHLGLFCANANGPVGDAPALFTHREVETLFHEFGHLLHHLFSTVPVRSLAGTNVAWDWVELPSQIMENWCWEREALDLFAAHYQTGERIPEELFNKMLRTRTYRAANHQMRQLGFATVDLKLHREFNEASAGDVTAYTRDILAEHTPTPLPERYGFIASFSHLFSSPVAYAAGYYSYKWSEVLDADAFTRFKRGGIFSAETGNAFRHEILARGDSADPGDLYRSFMGRDPKIEPLLQRQGLT